MLPSESPELAKYPKIKYVFEKQVDMFFVDLRCMLKSPYPGCNAGYNLTIASMLLNIIAGFSRRLYRPPESMDDNQRFKSMLVDFFHWENPYIKPEDGANLLYRSLRNPLTHELGIKGEEKVIVSKSGRSSDEEIEELENNEAKPSWIQPPLKRVNLYEQYFEWHVSVTSLYWATHRLLHNLLRDDKHVLKAERRLNQILERK